MNEKKTSSSQVMIVDDEESIRLLLEEFLLLEGYTTLSASNGKEALELLRKSSRPCLILLDMMMPVMNGRDFLDALLSDEQLSSIPVLFVSAFENIDTKGSVGVMKKPVDINKLLDYIGRYCSLRSG